MEIVLIGVGFLGLLAWGDRLVARLLPGFSERPLERALAGFGLLFGAGAYAIHALGFAGLLYKPLAYAVVLICLGGVVVWALGQRGGAIRQSGRSPLPWSDRLFVAAICVAAAINLLGCLTPEIRDDCLINHQSIPAGYANAHRIDMHPYNANMGRPQLLHAYYILPLLFQNVFGPKLIHSMIALVGLAALGCLAADTVERKAKWISLYLFYTLPVVVMYATCAYVDLGRIYYEVFPLWLILRFQQTRRRSDLLLAAVIFGFGMGVHWLSVFFGWPVLTATVFFAVLLGGGNGRWKRACAAAALFGLVAAVVFSPWIIRNWLLLGNPAQPLFRVPAGAGEAQRFSPEVLGYFGALKELPQRLYRAVWVITRSGNCPPILLLGALVLKFAMRDRDPRRSAMLIFAVLHLLIFAAVLPIQDGRYILPGFAVSVVLFFHYVERFLSGYPQYRRYLVGGVLVLGLLNFTSAKHRLYYDFGEPPWPVYRHRAVERFLTRRFGDRSMIHYVNAKLPAGSKVLLDDAVGALYIWRPFMARNYHDPRILNSLIRKTENNDELLARLREYGLTHILVEHDFPPEDLDDSRQARLRQFVRNHLRRVHQIGTQKLYEITK